MNGKSCIFALCTCALLLSVGACVKLNVTLDDDLTLEDLHRRIPTPTTQFTGEWKRDSLTMEGICTEDGTQYFIPRHPVPPVPPIAANSIFLTRDSIINDPENVSPKSIYCIDQGKLYVISAIGSSSCRGWIKRDSLLLLPYNAQGPTPTRIENASEAVQNLKKEIGDLVQKIDGMEAKLNSLPNSPDNDHQRTILQNNIKHCKLGIVRCNWQIGQIEAGHRAFYSVTLYKHKI